MTGSQMVNPERLRSLLHSLSLGKLDKAHAGELKRLLLEELAKTKNDLEHEKELEALIKILDSYISGQIDLMFHALSPNKTKYQGQKITISVIGETPLKEFLAWNRPRTKWGAGSTSVNFIHWAKGQRFSYFRVSND